MDASSVAVATDTLGRRIAPRQRHTRAEKRSMVEESLAPGTSVALVARRHAVNANQIFAWRRQYRAGLLEVRDTAAASQLLPVEVAAVRSSTGERKACKRRDGVAQERLSVGVIEIEFPAGQRMRLCGAVDAAILAQVIAALLRP
jgi:transposase